MRITKFGHACVRVEHEGAALVIDPGGWTEGEAVEGATALLVTHEHPDHLDVAHLRAAEAPIFTIDAVALRIAEEAPDLAERVTVVGPGDDVAAGLAVRVVGELHAVIHPELPRFHNSGYLVSAGGSTVFHPGDALTVPDRSVDVLCVPVSAPWLKAAEAVDFARAVGAPRNLAIHDRVYSPEGLGIVDGHFERLLPPEQSYVRLREGADL
ncbi:MBL fold metallo-hydrolase [Nocardioides coralli]|uniref:MBL fold metallo-hydrolase n=1 Tax=Nocardioides coralli TaxID=2872154 RepID=UPI001CA38AD2|nr:MBL fold metallo-hydrolase [Nocardioides coralli]QZY29475.1 MBL fold metallo-hydrolase [Nocardioides coralli]